MSTYLALLRGINVGGNNKVSMAELKTVFEDLGFSDVRTYINSGNVIFKTEERDEKKLVREIEEGIRDHFGLDIPVVVRSKEEIDRVTKEIPAEWMNDQEQRTDVMFLWEEVDTPDVLQTIKINPEVDILKYTKGAVIWHLLRKNYTKSRMNKIIGTHFYKHQTARNVNTVRKLQELMK